ncbi:MAG: hypothetical protein KC425_02680 [Anaerolineales bacterium]|nr:hypothetical protein [Anaerolineales bacterium]
MSQYPALDTRLARWQRPALAVGALGLALCALGGWLAPAHVFRAYLFGFIFWASLGLGCLGLLMFHHVTGGRWGFPLRRVLEAGAATVPLLALLFVPLLFGLPDLYAWARPAAVAADPLLQHKRPFLNVPFFIARTAVYFLVWSGCAILLARWSRRQDATADPGLSARARRLSTAGLILYLFTASLAAVDWLMSLEPHWTSHVYGWLFIASQLFVALALALVPVVLLRRRPAFAELLDATTFDDLGNLLLAFLLMWLYLAFIQYLVIWQANLPEGVTWYLRRTAGGWQWLAAGVLALHAGVPFLLLILRGALAHRARTLLLASACILLFHLGGVYWLVMPAFYPAAWRLHWLDAAAVLGIGGPWLALALRRLRGAPLLPRHDPRLQEVLSHE